MAMLTEMKSQKSECPCCHAPDAYGPRTVFGQFWMRRCSKCRYYKSEPLPTIQKKIIYLDQFVLSNILSAKETRWTEVHQRLKLLMALEVVACPYSPIHVEESLLASHTRDALKCLYRDLSGGDTFLTPHEITQNQLLDAIRRYLAPEPPSLVWTKPRPWQEFAKENPHHWSDDLIVFAELPTDLGRIARLQHDKDDLHADLQVVAENWSAEANRFNDDMQREALSFGVPLLAAYREVAGGRRTIKAMLPSQLLPAFHDAFGPERFDPNTPPGVQPGVMLVHWLAAEVYEARPEETDPVAVVEKFFQSPEAMNVPFQYIASRLWATIAQQVRNKKPRPPKASDNYDVMAISTYAPYCDAMIVDNEFRGMVSQKNIDVEKRFNVRIFSARTLPDFIGYLDNLLANIPDDHRRAVQEVHRHLAILPWLKID